MSLLFLTNNMLGKRKLLLLCLSFLAENKQSSLGLIDHSIKVQKASLSSYTPSQLTKDYSVQFKTICVIYIGYIGLKTSTLLGFRGPE